MIDFEGWPNVEVYMKVSVTKGTTEHGCCVCHVKMLKRKTKLLLYLADWATGRWKMKTFWVCNQCMQRKDHALANLPNYCSELPLLKEDYDND